MNHQTIVLRSNSWCRQGFITSDTLRRYMRRMRQKAGFDYLKEHLLSFPSAGPEEQNPSSDTTSCRTFCSMRSIAGNLIPLSTTCVIRRYNAGGRQIPGTERVMSDTVSAESEGESSSQLFALEVFFQVRFFFFFFYFFVTLST